jgi:hypothetical protein
MYFDFHGRVGSATLMFLCKTLQNQSVDYNAADVAFAQYE